MRKLAIAAIALAAAQSAAVHAGGPTPGDNRFCGGVVRPTVPSDLANVEGELSIQHAAEQAASMTTCAMGYLIEKCGDHETAARVFDKCIAAGYAGAMIWKALMYENGNGVPQDYAKAAELFKRAADSGTDHSATLGKLHYATALHLGRGVPRDEAAARKLFEEAAAQGSEEATDFLRTGYHTGDRDVEGVGAGVRPAWADTADRGLREPGIAAEAAAAAARGERGDVAEARPAASRAPAAARRAPARVAAAQTLTPAAPTPPAPVEAPADAPVAAPQDAAREIDLAAARVVDEQLRERAPESQHLARVEAPDPSPASGDNGGFLAALLATFAAGAATQWRGARGPVRNTFQLQAGGLRA